ncbi:putative Killer toxin subunits alpha/beta [Glarea lozoyensis 74030]|uniref:chitinase n=1 Tax=Glarea lozoyensis (strain ATCC 74030 / MF5533) TaxID=1104152 RepID=H0EYF4_GLAL7|nr:putative Killer toxin subunits alpha/beta [Glarea lozoyensis 74030]
MDHDPTTNVLIRSCTLTTSSPGVNSRIFSGGDVNLTNVDNPKKSNRLSRVRLGSTSACSSTGTQVPEVLEIQASGGGSRNDTSDEIAGVLLGFQKYFITRDNCDENFAFAFYGQTVASIYIGSDLAKPTALSAIKALMQQSQVSAANRTIVQRCGLQTGSTRTFGVAIDTTGDLAGVQEMAANWAKGNCVSQDNLQPSGSVKINLFNLSGPGAANNITLSSNSTLSSNGTLTGRSIAHNVKRATCRYIQVVANDGCGSLVSRCGISAADFTKFNPKANLCSTLQVKDYVCCSAGDPYTEPKPDPPKPGADGVCATHLIQNGDTCDSLSKKYGVTIDDLERWNKFKTWAWTECKAMLLGYNMCVSSGDAALPPSQAGTECGPLVPGTQRPANSATSIADLNPCPLKACCSNWGYCGVFPAHCDVHTPLAGGPGSVTPGFLSTCVSNCGVEIKLNSAAPAAFQRIGYYESYSFERDCLWLKAKNANTDGSYTHIHWAFADIDPATWKPVIKESSKGQWAEFKALKNVKRIVSLGGWAASTEPATYNIIRSAIISNRNLFASNLATFAKTEGIDGIDIDWEYPGAPDILVGGEPIGKKTDGLDYLKFLTILKQQAGTSLSVSIAAPASYWYLKGFPIDRIAAVIDYIVYMTYDLHGQWDYGNPNAYDKCDSGKCIRSHVNLTETRNSLSISDYVSYMTPTTKETRRADWKGLNFAGSIDWAVDLQSFTADDMAIPPDRPTDGEEGCVEGEDMTTNSGDLYDIVVTDDDDPNVIDYDSIDQANMKRYRSKPSSRTSDKLGMHRKNSTERTYSLDRCAQIGCYILMSAIKIVMDIGVQAIPGVGKGMDAGLDMATTAAQMAAYAYPEEEDPEGAFSWWLSPCGGTNLVPEELKKAFNILSTVAGGVSNFKVPKNVPKGSGKKGDEANPTDRAKPKPSGSGSGKNKGNPAYVGAGTKSVGGQLARLLPGTQNSGAASMWKSMCFNIPAKEVSDRDMKDQIALDPDKKYGEVVAGDKRTFTYLGAVNVRTRPKFTISSWPASAPNDGLNNNPCWPSGRAPEDPAYALIAVDPYYTDKTRPYDYTKPYVPGQNGV